VVASSTWTYPPCGGHPTSELSPEWGKSHYGIWMNGCIHLPVGSDEGSPWASVRVPSGENPNSRILNGGSESRGLRVGEIPIAEGFGSRRTIEKSPWTCLAISEWGKSHQRNVQTLLRVGESQQRRSLVAASE